MELLRMEACDVPPGLRHAFAADVTRCVYLERLHWVDDAPIALAQTCLLPEASDVAFARADSLPTYELLEQLLGWRIADADMSVTAVAAPTISPCCSRPQSRRRCSCCGARRVWPTAARVNPPCFIFVRNASTWWFGRCQHDLSVKRAFGRGPRQWPCAVSRPDEVRAF